MVFRAKGVCDDYPRPGRLFASILTPGLGRSGSGESLKKCRLISSPVIAPSTPLVLNRAVLPAGQVQGRSLLPVSMTPVSSHFGQLDMVLLRIRAVFYRRRSGMISIIINNNDKKVKTPLDVRSLSWRAVADEVRTYFLVRRHEEAPRGTPSLFKRRAQGAYFMTWIKS
jgi:hypothetical protein